MKIKFIINPISGVGKQKGIEKYIAQYFDAYDIVSTQNPGEATTLSKEARKQGYDAVIAVGGDGTVNECAKALIGSSTALGIIPCGSGNGFAYHIGMERTAEKALRQLKNARIATIDSCTANGVPFVNVSGIGFDAYIAHLFSKLTKRGFLNYIKLIAKSVFSYKAADYTLQYGTENKRLKAYMISFANASQYGNDFCIAPKADLQDGLLDFVIVKEFPKWNIPLFLLKVIRGKTHLSKYIETIQTKEMKISTQNTLLHLDGEPYKTTNPIAVELLPKTLKILIPHGKK